MVQYHIIHRLIFMSFYICHYYTLLVYSYICVIVYVNFIKLYIRIYYCYLCIWYFVVVHQQNTRSSSPERAQHRKYDLMASYGICASPRKQLELSRRRWSKFSRAPAKSPEHWEATPAVLLLLWCGLVARSCKLENLNWSTILYNLQFWGVSLSDVKII